MTFNKNIKKSPLGCGIVGCKNIKTSSKEFSDMLDTLEHRGPNGKGIWESQDSKTFLGHTRLSIIGIDERGSQPMKTLNDKLIITFNGEIYNYFELRKDLEKKGYQFFSDTDTEVVLYAYDYWGIDCLLKFNGIFAFGLYDMNKNELLLARDHLGVKPLLYTEVDNNGIIFASEAKAILKHHRISASPNYDAIRDTWLHHLWRDNHETWFKGINYLQPGHYMIINELEGVKEIKKYWDINMSPNNFSNDLENWKSEFQSLIKDAVHLQTQSNVGFSTTVSGGLDSTTITSLIAQNMNKTFDSFTIKYSNTEKIPSLEEDAPEFTSGLNRNLVDLWHAKKLSENYSNINLIEVDIKKNDFNAEEIDKVIYHLEEMPTDSRLLTVYKLYEKIKEHGHKVVLIGQGPDEVWMGYYYDDEFWRFPAEFTSKNYLANVYFPDQVPFGFSAWNPNFLNKKIAVETSRINISKNMNCNFGDIFNDISYFGKNTILQSLLLAEDRMSMAHSLEARVPWVDYRLMDLAFQIPSYIKIDSKDDNKAKYFSRDSLKGLVPDFIIDRKKSPLSHPPKEYKNTIYKNLIVPNHLEILKSKLLNEIFTKEFLENLIADKSLTMNDLFKIYSLWRFEKIFL